MVSSIAAAVYSASGGEKNGCGVSLTELVLDEVVRNPAAHQRIVKFRPGRNYFFTFLYHSLTRFVTSAPPAAFHLATNSSNFSMGNSPMIILVMYS